MSDIVARLRQGAGHEPKDIMEAERTMDEAAAGLERLRTALLSCPCPGGGWNGMPKDIEPTVEACVTHKVCGCDLGRALEEKT